LFHVRYEVSAWKQADGAARGKAARTVIYTRVVRHRITIIGIVIVARTKGITVCMVRTHTAARVLRYDHRFTQAAAHSTLQPLEFAVARALWRASRLALQSFGLI
jgi:hypothetical protein